jgi:hypothetical protein
MVPTFRTVLLVAITIGFLLAPRAGGAVIPEEIIDRAVERGVAALRKIQAADGSFPSGSHGTGPTALAALTLLECGIAPADEQVQKAVSVIRNDCPTMNRVYHTSLAVMLLDRLNDPLDEPIIQALTVRLLEMQVPSGGWGYGYISPAPTSLQPVPAEEAQKLKTLIERRAELRTDPSHPPPGGHSIDPELIERLKQIERRRTAGGTDGYVDNSNTQFALLALWVGRRHGIPVDGALKRTEVYFRATHDRGVWPYLPNTAVDSRAANTCSGLIGLAIGAGLAREAQLRTNPERKDGKPPALRDPLKDPLVQAAMNHVGGQLAEVAAKGLNAEPYMERSFYFFWSVERVGMIYSVPRMGGVDWYQTGAAAILQAQQQDGSWSGGSAATRSPYSADINTCFALLFLRRSNVAHDLTANLRKKLNQPSMHAGGEKGEPAPEAAPHLSEAETLARELAKANPERQEVILGQLRDGKGGEFTDALAHAIPKLNGDAQKKARDALAERLARMTAATVRGKLKDDNVEVRRAAALACAMKSDKAFVPDLIATLDDTDHWVVRAAAVALRSLTGEDFGPSATATSEERAKSVAAWKAWWKRQGGH